jgi:ribosomal protein L11 methyltransferase
MAQSKIKQPPSSQLLQVSIQTGIEAEEAVSEMLGNAFQVFPSVFTLHESKQTEVSIYLQHLPTKLLALIRTEASVTSQKTHRATLTGQFDPGITKVLKRWLQEKLRHIQAAGLDVGPAVVSLRRLKPQDWAESWKRHFPPIDIKGRLLIRPSWSKRRPRKGQEVISIDPGLSFGTGQHPTTSFCLHQVVSASSAFKHLTFLDLGTGSGILAIAAAKMGYESIIAIDHDAHAIRIAKENARSNSVAERIQFSCTDLTAWSIGDRCFDVVCANLQSDLLSVEALRITKAVRHGGCLTLAGILTSQFGHVQDIYERLGWKAVKTEASGEWKSGVFSYSGR